MIGKRGELKKRIHHTEPAQKTREHSETEERTDSKPKTKPSADPKAKEARSAGRNRGGSAPEPERRKSDQGLPGAHMRSGERRNIMSIHQMGAASVKKRGASSK